MIPDPEAVLTTYLTDVAGALGGTVRGKTPKDTTDPWVRLTLLDAPSTDGGEADHLIAAYLQLDCYAGSDGGHAAASLLARTVREALVTITDGDHGDVVVTGAKLGGYQRLPDTDFEPARERYVLSATVWLHG